MTHEIAEGRFREDLFYRLNVVPIIIPKLSARKEDIGVLSEHFMRQAAETSGHAPRAIENDALSALQAYKWPGNVRELRNVIERMLIMAPGGASESIGVSGLPPEIGADVALPSPIYQKAGKILLLFSCATPEKSLSANT